MTIETNLNQSPFFDDFDETKNFHRVLFRPGYAVQARELTQIQSILQNQIERFGVDVYKDGTVIDGCNAQAQVWSYVKLNDKNAANAVIVLTQFFDTAGAIEDVIISGATSGVTARLLDAVDGSETAAPDYLTVFVSYTNSGTDGATKTFADNEELTFTRISDSAVIATTTTIASAAAGTGTGAHVSAGTVFHKGNFIKVSEQAKVASKYESLPSIRVGLETKEFIIDSFQDSSLLDNASGSTNFSAPGASRLKLTPTIATRPLVDTGVTETTGFIPLFDIQEGRIIRNYTDGQFSGVADELAKRTYEESGDYSIEPFVLTVDEHLNDGVTGGTYLSTEADNEAGLTEQGDASKLVVEVDPSVGYVQGYRIETTDKIRQSISKANTFARRENVVVGQGIGNYIICDEVMGIWNFTDLQEVKFYASPQNVISTVAFNDHSVAGTLIGSAKIRGMQWHEGQSGTSAGKFRIYITDIQMVADKSFKDVRSLYVAESLGSGSHSFADVVLELDGNAKVQDASFAKLVFPIQSKGVKTLVQAETQYVTRKEADGNVAQNGTVTITRPASATGGTDTMNDTGTLTGPDERNVIIVAKETATVTLSGTITSGSISSGTGTLTGTSTAFDTQLTVGDFFTCHSGVTTTLRVVEVLSATSIIVAGGNGNPRGVITQQFPAGHIFDTQFKGTIAGGSTSHDINLQRTFVAQFDVQVYFDVLRSEAVPESKVVHKSKYIKINTNTHGAGANGPWDLGVSDAWKLESVLMGDTSVTLANGVESLQYFELDDGQRDGFYGGSRLVKKSSATSGALNTTDKGIIAKFSWFSRDTSGGIGFTTVDSYPVDDADAANASKIATPEIPLFVSSDGTEYDLRDSVDFRPAQANTCEPKADLTGIPSNPAAPSVFAVHGTHGVYPPTPDQNFQADVDVYLPRIDIVALRPNGLFDIKTGIPNETPVAPTADPQAMLLGTITIPGYPSLSPEAATYYGRYDYQVNLELENNRRYTMEDLREMDGDLEKTKEQVEINKLDIEALKISVLRIDDAADAVEPPKEVVIVNPKPVERYYNTLRSGDFISESSPIRPIPKMKDIDLEVKAGSLVNVRSGSVFKRLTRQNIHKSMLSQVFGTKRLPIIEKTTTPIRVFNGRMSLSHSMCHIKQTPSGVSSGTLRKMLQDYKKAGIDYTGLAEFSDLSGLGKSRSANDYVIAAHRAITVRCTGLKPSTKVWPRFDGRDVTKYTQQTGQKKGKSYLMTDSTGKLTFLFFLPNDSTMKFRGLKHLLEVSDVQPPIVNGISSGKNGSTTRCGQYYLAPSKKSKGLDPKTVQKNITNLVLSELSADKTQTNVSIKEIPQELPDFLSQVFIVPSSKIDGVFCHHIRLFFAKASSDTSSSVLLQIREVDRAGGPTNVLVSQSEPVTRATIAAAASTTTNANPVEFDFDERPFLTSGKAYAFTVIPTDSKDEYELWTGIRNQPDVVNNKSAYSVPGLGDLFSSATGNNWAKLPNEALKFDIRQNAYTKSATSTFELDNSDTEFLNVNAITPFGPSTATTGFQTDEIVRGTCLMTITHDAAVTIVAGDALKSKVAKNVPDYDAFINTNTDTTTWADGTVRAVVSEPTTTTTLVQIDAFGNFPTSTANTHSTLFRNNVNIGVASAFTANTVQGKVSFLNTDYGRIRLSDSTGTTTHGFGASQYIRGQERGAGALITEVANIDIDAITINAPLFTPKFTKIDWQMKTTSLAGVTDTAFSSVQPNERVVFAKDQKRIYSASNRDTKSLLIKGTMTTTDVRVGPTVDVNDASVSVEQERISATTGNEQFPAGEASARYISQVVPASRPEGGAGEKFFFAVRGYMPKEGGVTVYVRARNENDPEPIEDKIFTQCEDYFTRPAEQSTLGDFTSSTSKLFRLFSAAGTDNAGFATANKLFENTLDNKIIAYESTDGSRYSGIDYIQYKIVLTRPDGKGRDYTPSIHNLTSVTHKRPV